MYIQSNINGIANITYSKGVDTNLILEGFEIESNKSTLALSAR